MDYVGPCVNHWHVLRLVDVLPLVKALEMRRNLLKLGTVITHLIGTGLLTRKAGPSVIRIMQLLGCTDHVIHYIASRWPSVVHTRTPDGPNVQR